MKRIVTALCALALTATGALCETKNWPQFRGPTGDGHALTTDLPLEWSEDRNVTWKAAIHDRGWSSPVIWGDRIWLTTASEDGRKLYALCLDKASGKILYDRQLFDIKDPQFAHKFNSYASPTPVIEEGRVYVTFGSPGTACIDTESFETLWTRTDIECDHFRGAGSSPVLFGNLLINNYDGADLQFVLALDKRTGKTAWRTERSVDYRDIDPATGKPKADGDFRKAFSTPNIARIGDQYQLISQGAKASYGYQPETGKEIWRYEELNNHSASTRPVVGDGLIYLPSGFPRPHLTAVKFGVKGRVTEEGVAWEARRSVPKKPSVTLVGDLLFSIDDGGIATCWDAKTGEQYWNERVRGNYSASPLFAQGRLYFLEENGKAAVIAASDEFKLLAESELAEGFMASPAVSENALYLRSKTHLYRIEN